MSIAISRTSVPTGVWSIDPAHSRIEFAVKHLGIATVRGVFNEFEGALDLDSGRAAGTATAASIDTNDETRDAHLRSGDFFDADRHPRLLFESTAINPIDEDSFEVEGELTMRGVTRPIVLRAELQGAETDPYGNERIGLEVSGQLDRSEWGMTFNQVLGSGNLLVSDQVKLRLDISAVKQAD